jgi:hypothetical protein
MKEAIHILAHSEFYWSQPLKQRMKVVKHLTRLVVSIERLHF